MARRAGDEAIMTVVGQRLRECREALGVSQERLAEVAGFDRGYVSLVERGRVNVSVTTLVRLAAAAEVDPAGLVSGLDGSG